MAGVPWRYNLIEAAMSTHDKGKNATLKPDVLAALAQQAKTEGKTPDDLANELLDAVLKLREQSKADQQWQELLSYGRGQAKKLGIRESDVPRLVTEWRAEQRGR
jgi:hypothetical protein